MKDQAVIGVFILLAGSTVGLAIYAWHLKSAIRQMTKTCRELTDAKIALDRHAAVVQSTDDAIVTTDLDGIVTTWNPGAERIFGHSPAEMIGHSILKIVPADRQEEEQYILGKARRCENLHRFETLRQNKAGQLIDVSVTTSPLKDVSGAVIGISKVSRNITDRKAAEKLLQELNETLELKVINRTKELEMANTELESFSYSVSHDLRAPLRAIAGFTQILKENYESALDGKGREYLGRVLSATERMGVLIDDMLTLSRITRDDFHPAQADLGALARHILNGLRQSSPERGVEMVLSQDMTVKGDPHLLQILLENLLGNAWKFTSKNPGGRIEFSVHNDDSGRIFCLQDNGAGFDMRYAEKIFAPFQRLHSVTEFPGTGIGLAIAQRVVHRHGGRIWADGAVDQGAKFYFTINTP